MPGLTTQQIHKIVYRYIGVEGGYLGDFSYRTHGEFYPLYCDLDIDPDDFEGTTRERFMAILGGLAPSDQRKVIEGVTERFPVTSGGPATRTEALRAELLEIASALGGVATPGGLGTDRASVARAIADADVLIRTNGAVSAVDRIHTAIHGYLLAECDKAEIPRPDDPKITQLLKLLRNKHPVLTGVGQRGDEVDKILNSIGNVLDALNTLRNRASVAHPNEALLEDPEAQLAIDSANTVLSYLDSKLRPRRTPGPERNNHIEAVRDEEQF